MLIRLSFSIEKIVFNMSSDLFTFLHVTQNIATYSFFQKQSCSIFFFLRYAQIQKHGRCQIETQQAEKETTAEISII